MTTNTTFSSFLEPEKGFLDEKHPSSPQPPPTPRRGSDESSIARSEYEDVPTLTEKTGASTKVLEVYHTGSHINYRITSPDNSPLYYVNNSQFTPNTPDVTLHAGSEKTGPILGVCKWGHMYSKTVKVGLGDPNNMGGNNMIWVNLDRTTSTSFKQSEFKFTMTPANSHERKTFVWKRSSKKEVGDDEAYKWSFQNFRLLDESTGEKVAIFANNGLKSWKKKGKFRLWSGVYGDDWEKMVLLTGLSIIEKARRRRRAAKYGNHDGGPLLLFELIVRLVYWWIQR